MNVVEELRRKIHTLPDGDYVVGLRSVLVHLETAFKHLRRGQTQREDQAFTDAIYRCNQAFEGSIKEAYRVLAERQPEQKTSHEIEQYLQDNKVFRQRVLSQFTNYRRQWRNPSTHDYTLSFDPSEAFVALTQVAAFAYVLIDQIAERIAFQQASESAKGEAATAVPRPDDAEPATLGEQVGAFLAWFDRVSVTLPIQSDVQLSGACRDS